MTITHHTCITVRCDICKYAYDEDEYTAHFTNLDEARKIVRSQGWTITSDSKVFCASGDMEHQTALEALMPPEPVMQVPGQLGLEPPRAAPAKETP